MNLGEIFQLQKKLDELPQREGHFHFIYNSDVLLHQPQREGHPEVHDRARVILESALERAQFEPWVMHQANPTGWSALRKVHDPDYLLGLESTGHANKPFFQSEDCSLGYDSLDGILAAAGCATELGRLMAEGKSGFALTRPPGHHAGIKEAEGFCFLNHSALAVNEILQKDPNAKVLIVDFDVHHGNGIEEFFLESSDIFYFSIHGTPKHLYPWTGEERVVGKGMGEGYTCNITLPMGTSGDDWIQQFKEGLEDVSQRFQPDYLLVSAGFDAHLEDPYEIMKVEDSHYIEAISVLTQLAMKTPQESESQHLPKMGLMLEGGYSLKVLARLVPEIVSLLSREFNE